MTKANEYLKTKVMTASPGELRLLLLDGAIRFARQGREGLACKNFEQSFEGLSSCRAIITELIVSMRPEHDPELCERVRSLYTYFFNELTEAGMSREVARVDKVIDLLEYERETWRLLLEKLDAEKPASSASPDAAPAARPSLSLQA